MTGRCDRCAARTDTVTVKVVSDGVPQVTARVCAACDMTLRHAVTVACRPDRPLCARRSPTSHAG